MNQTTLKNKNHRTLAHIEVDSRGVHRITDHHHRLLGYYDPRTNRTTDHHHRLVGYGYLLPKLIPADLAEDNDNGIIKPMTPAQANKEAKRKQGIQQRVQGEQRRSADKLRDLRAKLTTRP